MSKIVACQIKKETFVDFYLMVPDDFDINDEAKTDKINLEYIFNKVFVPADEQSTLKMWKMMEMPYGFSPIDSLMKCFYHFGENTTMGNSP